MKKILISLFALALLFSCSKDDVKPDSRQVANPSQSEPEPEAQPVNLVPVTFRVQMDGSKVGYYSGLKKGFHGNDVIFIADNGLNASSATADPATGVSVGNNIYSTISFIGASLMENASEYFSVYPHNSNISFNGSLISHVVLPVEQYAPANGFQTEAMLLFAKSNNFDLFFKNLCGYISLNCVINGCNCASITVESKVEGIAGECAIDVASSKLVNLSSKVVTVRPASGTTFDDGKEYFMPIAPGVYTQLVFTAKDASGNVLATRVVRGKEYARSGVYTIDLNGSDLAVVGASIPLGGFFSVSNEKKVRFSSGNLQYQASTGLFRFAQDQYLSVGADNSSISSTNDGWIDLFGWGTKDAPFKTSLDDAQYTSYSNWGAMMNDNVFAELKNNGYRELKNEEWQYLLARPDKTAMATVNAFGSSYMGLLLLPDDFTLPNSCSYTAGFAQKYATNTYSFDQWEAMQKAGAVFLPAAGFRNGTTVESHHVVGGYWAAGSYTLGTKPISYYLNFGCGDAFVNYNDYRHTGRSVRLVVDVN